MVVGSVAYLIVALFNDLISCFFLCVGGLLRGFTRKKVEQRYLHTCVVSLPLLSIKHFTGLQIFAVPNKQLGWGSMHAMMGAR